MIYYENNYNYASRIQSEDRCHRIGQKKKVLYIDLMYKDTIDQEIYKALKNKKNVAEYMMNNKNAKRYNKKRGKK